jgi:hypothetical protein
MGGETRGGRAYYYTAEKQNGKVVKAYHGARGEADAEAMATILEGQRISQAREGRRESSRRHRLRALEETVRTFCQEVDACTREALTAAGYHQHNRGEWRRRRRKREGTEGATMAAADKALVRRKRLSAAALADIEKATDPKLTDRERDALVDRLEPDALTFIMKMVQGPNPDEGFVPMGRAIVRKAPPAWIVAPSMYLSVRRAVIAEATSNPIDQELYERRAQEQFEEVAGPNPSPLERLLSERIVVCWLSLFHLERTTARVTNLKTAARPTTISV